jgi:hypothetical protein
MPAEYSRVNATLTSVVCGWLSIGTVFAAPVVTVQVSVPGEITSLNHPSGIALEDNAAFPDGRTGSAFAQGALHGLGATASVVVPVLELNPGESQSIATGASATVRFDDIVITNLADPTNLDPIQVTTNFFLDGAFSFGPGTTADNALVTASLGLLYGIGTGPASAANSIGSILRVYSDGVLNESDSGIFAGAGLGGSFSFHGEFVTVPLTVAVGTPIRLSLGLTVGASAVSRNFHTPTPVFGPALSLTSDFQNTLRFSTSGPALNLPDGYTVNSAQAGIVNNQFSAVPLPPALLLFASALVPFSRRICRRGGKR